MSSPSRLLLLLLSTADLTRNDVNDPPGLLGLAPRLERRHVPAEAPLHRRREAEGRELLNVLLARREQPFRQRAALQHLEVDVNGGSGPSTTLRDARPETIFARMVFLKAREIGRMINYAAGARGVSGGGQKG